MKVYHLLVAGFSLFSTALEAQTKKIAFESHSGSPENFNISLTNDLFDSDNSDFGLPTPKEVKTYKLDSVIFVSDTVSVVVKKEYSRLFTAPKDSAKFTQTLKDTVYNDPLFARKHSLDSIKTVLKTDGQYINPARKVVFIGYDNNKPADKKQNILPLVITDDPPNNNPPFDMQLALMLGTILLLSLLGGWLSWRFYQSRLQQRRA
jgi:hypothetical protein